jgi:hypothetical protein
MAVHRTDEFAPASRYLYDFGACSTGNGFAQFDSRQDAEYFGNWINPTKRIWFSYTEGDTTLIRCDTDAEFVAYVRETFAWYEERDGRRPGIDPGFSEDLKAAFVALGLGDLLH